MPLPISPTYFARGHRGVISSGTNTCTNRKKNPPGCKFRVKGKLFNQNSEVAIKFDMSLDCYAFRVMV